MPYADPYATKTTSGAGSEGLPFNKVDIAEPAWTTANPSSIAGASATTDGSGLITFKWTGVTDSTSDNSPVNGANFDGPRAYIPLLKPDGSNYLWTGTNANIRLMVNITDMTRPRDDGSSNNPTMVAVLGFCKDPTSTSRNNTTGMVLSGIGGGFNTVSSQRIFINYTGPSNNNTASIFGRSAVGSVGMAGNGVGACDLLIQRDDGRNTGKNSRNTNVNFQVNREGEPIYLCLAWGPAGAGQDLSGKELKMKIQYKIVNFETIN
tara:strand:- start:1572 stop:2363 length:792 start_codon:yes stop_codon:yes gene_type:complete